MTNHLEKMITLATQARENSYSPYSNFPVGCCIKTASGKLYSGTNVENCAYHSTHCAETSAIGAMITDGEREIAEIVIVTQPGSFGTPCGNCRQKFSEFTIQDAQVHVCNPGKLIKTIPFSELLPHKFVLHYNEEQ